MTSITLHIDGAPLAVAAGCSVAAALARTAGGCTRVSVTGQLRAPLCGMGICHECRVTIDGRRQLACQTLCQDGMVVHTSTQGAADQGAQRA